MHAFITNPLDLDLFTINTWEKLQKLCNQDMAPLLGSHIKKKARQAYISKFFFCRRMIHYFLTYAYLIQIKTLLSDLICIFKIINFIFFWPLDSPASAIDINN